MCFNNNKKTTIQYDLQIDIKSIKDTNSKRRCSVHLREFIYPETVVNKAINTTVKYVYICTYKIAEIEVNQQQQHGKPYWKVVVIYDI